MNCSACKSALHASSSLQCVACKACFHYQCLNMSDGHFKMNIKELRRAWRCDSCMNITRRNRTDSTPVASPHRLQEAGRAGACSSLAHVEQQHIADMSCDESLINTSSVSCGSAGTSQAKDVDVSITMKQFSDLIDAKLDSIRIRDQNREIPVSKVPGIPEIQDKIKSELEKVTNSIRQEFSETTDFLHAEQKDLKKSISEQNSNLRAELNSIGMRLKAAEKTSRSCNVEVQCVPERRSENLVAVFKNLCKEIELPITDMDIRSCRRVAKMNPTSKRPRNILVTLPSERHRDQVISYVKRYNLKNAKSPINSGHVGVPGGENCPIFVSEHLSKDVKELHAAARRAAKDKAFKYVWVKYGRV
ncbi:hypothetical protein ABMA27_011395 [Loxostege sticticalis]|uniref:Zinc finger PHD-type domain-containing protein n=1 Tax=Loxostege sticticalis TaxID=481309 RepID=A0ABR3IG65_LOXSC